MDYYKYKFPIHDGGRADGKSSEMKFELANIQISCKTRVEGVTKGPRLEGREDLVLVVRVKMKYMLHH